MKYYVVLTFVDNTTQKMTVDYEGMITLLKLSIEGMTLVIQPVKQS